MNRRSFLTGLGAAVAAVAVATRLGETTLKLAAPDGVALNSAVPPWLTNPETAWFLKGYEEEEPPLRQFSEESLEELVIEIKRYSHRVALMPTHVIYGSAGQ